MDSVPKRTILDAIDGAWYHGTCSECSQPIGYSWQPLPEDPDAGWADPLLFRRLCAQCILKAAEACGGSPQDALRRANRLRSLRSRYRHIEHVWRAAGLREIADQGNDDTIFYTKREYAARQQQVRQLLRLAPDRRPTLTMNQWYPPGQHRSPNDPYLELFMITGKLPVASRASVHYGDFSEPPRYLIGEEERGGQREVFAAVLLEIHACYPPARPTEVRWRWNPLTPDVDHDPKIELFGHCDRDHLADLVRHAHRLYYETSRPGRTRDTTKRWPPGTEEEFLDEVNAALSRREDGGVSLTKAEQLADAIGMSRSALYDMFRRVPEANARWQEHKRKASRR